MAWKMSLIRLTFLSCKLSFNVILAVAGTNTSEWHWTWESNPPVSLELRRKPLALQDRFTNVLMPQLLINKGHINPSRAIAGWLWFMEFQHVTVSVPVNPGTLSPCFLGVTRVLATAIW